MQPRQLLLIAFVCVLGGFAAARLLAPADKSPVPEPAAGTAAVFFDSSQSADLRLLELERAVSEERQARLLLEEELLVLRDTIDSLRSGDRELPANAFGEESAESVALRASERRDRRENGARDYMAERVERLEAAGFPPDRAAWIIEREQQIQYEVLKARHDVERGGDVQAYRDAVAGFQNSFRDELGDAEYERYLEGTGRSTAVDVGTVMDASPAQAAGLRPGDRIVRYAGKRIYDMRDLNQATLEGRAGEVIYVEIERDGMPMQVALPRGPVGITGGGRRPQ